MRIMMAVAMLTGMASAIRAQDPSRNRMNEQVPDAKVEDHGGRPSELSGLPSPFANRLNVQYGEHTTAEITGDLNPNENRMNYPVPKVNSKSQPKQVEPIPFNPNPRP